jgi:hypothetical protein
MAGAEQGEMEIGDSRGPAGTREIGERPWTRGNEGNLGTPWTTDGSPRSARSTAFSTFYGST